DLRRRAARNARVNRGEFLAAAFAASFAPAALARERAAAPHVLVTADTESHVAALSAATGRVLHRLPTELGPRSIETVGGRLAVVAHTTRGVVSILDGGPLRVRHVLRSFTEPRYTAAHPDGRFAFVTDSKRGEVVTLDVLRGGVLARLQLDGP